MFSGSYLVKTTKSMAMGGLLAGVLWGTLPNSLLAEEVTLFRSHATADEIVNGFMGGPQSPGRTRSIQINGNSRPPAEIGKSTPSITYRPPAPVGANVSSPGCPSGKSVAMNIPFEYNSADLTAEARTSLSEVAKAMLNPALTSCQFVVEGHTDAKGELSYNMTLSQRRARTVQRYLASRGIKTSRLKVEGKGPTVPIVPNDPYADENRRVQFRAGGG